MQKIIIIFSIFFFDRITKLYLLNLQAEGIDVDFYIFPFLNFYLIWNTGIGFGLGAMEASIYYHILTAIILLVNIALIIFLLKSKGIFVYLFAIVIGGSLGNLFDRIYYASVPDFIDFHINDFHWFVFNFADVFITLGVICLIFDEMFLNSKKI